MALTVRTEAGGEMPPAHLPTLFFESGRTLADRVEQVAGLATMILPVADRDLLARAALLGSRAVVAASPRASQPLPQGLRLVASLGRGVGWAARGPPLPEVDILVNNAMNMRLNGPILSSPIRSSE